VKRYKAILELWPFGDSATEPQRRPNAISLLKQWLEPWRNEMVVRQDPAAGCKSLIKETKSRNRFIWLTHPL
jgi:hypothetical protein